MRHISSYLVIVAILLMTPVGIYTCGSLVNSLVVMRGDDMVTLSLDGASVPDLQTTDTAVTSYLFSPMAVAALTVVLPLSLFLFVALTFIIPPQINKRKPPTPPPTIFASII